MARYPVKPGTIVHLPHREAMSNDKASSLEQWGEQPDDQLQKLHALTRWLTATIALLSVLLCLAAGMLVHTLKTNTPASTIGKNYTITHETTIP